MDAPDAFRQQLLAAIPRLRRYARSLTQETHAADDLVQTALERALAHWHQYDQRRDLMVWLLSIAHNAHLDQRRRDRRLTVLEPEELTTRQDARQSGGDADPGLRLDLMQALDRLTPAHRAVLLMVSVEQFSYAECAEALGIPIGTVMSRMARARAAFRLALDGAPSMPATPAARPSTDDSTPALRRVI